MELRTAPGNAHKEQQHTKETNMSDINITIIAGRLVRDPVVRRAASGINWGTFSVASNYRYKPKNGEPRDETAVVACKAFGGWASALERHKKGDQALVTGRLVTEKWEKDGESHTQLVLICDSVRFFTLQNGSSVSSENEESDGAPGGTKDEDGRPPF